MGNMYAAGVDREAPSALTALKSLRYGIKNE